jgi:cytochrome c553
MSSVFRWTLRLVGGAIILLVLLGTVLYVMGSRAVSRTYEPTVTTVALPSDSTALAHGNHLSHVMGCRDCHGDRLQGTLMEDAPPFRITAPNLTPAGVGGDYTTEDWFRALRHGIGPDGRALLIMPSTAFNHLSDADAAALIAYLKTVEPVENDVPPTAVKPLGHVLAGLGEIDPAAEVALTLPDIDGATWDASVEFGRYLTRASCGHCHGPELQGQPSPNPAAPYAPSLEAAGKWRFETFQALMRTGVHPDGRTLDPKYMPWAAFRHHTDPELKALHDYLATLPPPEPEDTARR